MTGYTFTTAAQISTGLTVLASTYTTEFTALQSAFSATTGHNHDGSSGGGAPIALATAVTGTLPIANGGTASTTASAARTALGLAIGTNVQAYDADLAAIAGLTSAADKGIQFTGSGTAATYDLTAAGKALLDDADASAQRTTLGLVIGTDVQAQDAELSAIAGLTSAADKLPYFTGSGTAALADLPSYGRTLIANASAADARTDLLVPASDNTGVTGADNISNMMSLTAAEYAAIGAPNASTVYFIVG